ncbi:NAD(P)-dependent alcohol dehydrogenase, partial [Mesorhizobium sp. M8A.F.Ca.ET.161.01.1.1]
MAIARGYAATDASKPLTPFTFERREPNDDDVVIDIKYA